MSKSAEFAIAAALKKLIDYNSHNKFTVGLRTYAFLGFKEKRSKYANRRECVFFIWVGRKG